MVSLDLDAAPSEAPDVWADQGEPLPDIVGPPTQAGVGQTARAEVADVRVAMQRLAAAKAFSTMFVDGYLTPAFGARTKSEIDLLVLGCLINAGALDPGAPVYDLARALNLTPTRVRSLILNWQLRSTGRALDLRGALVQALSKTRFAKDGSLLTFGIENPLLREEVEARLKRRGIFADASFSREIVRLPVDAFAEFLNDLVDEATKHEVRRRLVEDHQLPDRSFKAVVAGLLSRLGEKVAGKAGEAIAGDLVAGPAGSAIESVTDRLAAFLSGVFRGDTAAAFAVVRPDELST